LSYSTGFYYILLNFVKKQVKHFFLSKIKVKFIQIQVLYFVLRMFLMENKTKIVQVGFFPIAKCT